MRFRTLGLVVLTVLTLAACGRQQAVEKPPEAGDTAVARVDGDIVWASDVKREAVAQKIIEKDDPLDIQSSLFRQTLDEVIDRKLLAGEAVKRGLDKEVATQRQLAAGRDRVLADALVDSAVQKAVSENAIQQLYQEQLKLARESDEFRARQIVLPNQADAEAAKKLLQAGGSFEALAMERSTDAATRFNGGDLGYFASDVMPDYSAALGAAKPGAVVGPFQTEAGWVLLKLEDRRKETPLTLEAARPQIVRFLTYAQVRSLLEKLRGGAKIEPLTGAGQDLPGAPQEPASAPPAAPATPPAVPGKK
ncbi:MAG: peptidyl-prolyl cis-trans isomerase [Caulobacterales bacterium]|nr:peptidyl-prolyl cis-trans isomerase [Caulobacterales bacterium]